MCHMALKHGFEVHDTNLPRCCSFVPAHHQSCGTYSTNSGGRHGAFNLYTPTYIEVLQRIIRLCLIVISNFISDLHETAITLSGGKKAVAVIILKKLCISQIVDDETKILNAFPNSRTKMEETALRVFIRKCIYRTSFKVN